MFFGRQEILKSYKIRNLPVPRQFAMDSMHDGEQIGILDVGAVPNPIFFQHVFKEVNVVTL